MSEVVSPSCMHNLITGVDPGTTQTAWVCYDMDAKLPVKFGLLPNEDLLAMIRNKGFVHDDSPKMAIEFVASYGMPVGATVFETCVWVGRFIEAFLGSCRANEKPLYRKVYRKDEKMHLCGTMKAKDGNIRQTIMDRYGSTRELALGTKKTPGPLYGISKDIWAALAVAITGCETSGEWRAN